MMSGMPAPAAPPSSDPGASSMWRPPATFAPEVTALGVTRRQAALLAYSAGWISGLVILTLEPTDREVRWHAAQSLLGFGFLTAVAVLLLVLAGLSLFTSLTLFRVCLWAAQVLIAVGLVLWLWSLVQVARGREPRWPGLGRRAERLSALASSSDLPPGRR
jgi:uncharacterized membrane protein